MRRYYLVSVILLIVPIALAVPVPVQEKRQAGIDIVHIPKDAITTLGERGTNLNEMWLKYLSHFDDHFAEPEESSVARPSSSSPPSGPDHGRTDVEQPLPSIPKKPSPVSNPDYALPIESEYELVEEEEDAPPGPSRPASSTMSDANQESVGGAHALPNHPGPSTDLESDHESMGVHAPPMSVPVISTWFYPNHGLVPVRAHAPQPNLGPLNQRPSTESGSDHWLVVGEPPSRPASPTVSDADHEYQVVHPPPPSQGSASWIEFDDEMVDMPSSSPVH